MKSIPNKFTLKYKIAIFIVIIHLVYVFFVFHRENRIFSNLESSCTMHDDGQVGMPEPLLFFSDFYFFIPAVLLDSATEDIPRITRFSGTGGPCTFTTVNSAFPYSLIFILISSIVYYFIGLIIGNIFERKNKKIITK